MKLEGACACGAVQFQLESRHPVPYMRCYCGQCRKTNGSGGYGINIAGDHSTLSVTGGDNVAIYRARIQNPEDSSPRQSQHERHFCKQCGSHLWAWHPKWPELVHPLPSAIDTPLPAPPELTHIMLEFKPAWVAPDAGTNDRRHERYPEESIADWHERLELTSD